VEAALADPKRSAAVRARSANIGQMTEVRAACGARGKAPRGLAAITTFPPFGVPSRVCSPGASPA
jgi:hypothetical protein